MVRPSVAGFRRSTGITVASILIVAVSVLPAAGSAGDRSKPVDRAQGTAPELGPEVSRVSPDDPGTALVGSERVNAADPVPAAALSPHRSTEAEAIGESDGSSGPSRVTPLAPALTTSFRGMNQVCGGLTDCTGTSAYNGRYPPDTTIARSSTRLVELVNSRARLFDSAGTILQTTTLNQMFGSTASGLPVGEVLFDPKIYFDRGSATPRYFAVALSMNRTDQSNSRIWVAVSRSANPGSLTSAASWCRYWLSGAVYFGGSYTWADFPSIGVGARAFVVSTNQFSPDAGGNIQRSVLRAWDKNVLLNNSGSCPQMPSPYQWTRYTKSGVNYQLPLTLSPVQHHSYPTSFTNARVPTYLVNSNYDASSYAIWRVINMDSTSPLLQGPIQRSGNWTNHDPPWNPDGGLNYPLITSPEIRIQQSSGLGDRFFSVHGTSCQFGVAASPLEACIRLLRFFVGNNASGGLAATIEQQTVLGGGEGWYYAYPSVAVNDAGTVATAFSVSSASEYEGAAWVTKPWADSAYSGSGTFMARGRCLRDATYDSRFEAYRAGDYSGAAADPDGVRLWVAAERSTQITGIGCGWQTWIGAVTP